MTKHTDTGTQVSDRPALKRLMRDAHAALCRAHSSLNLLRDRELIPYEEFRDSVEQLLGELVAQKWIVRRAPSGRKK